MTQKYFRCLSFIFLLSANHLFGQVSLPERNPFKLSFRGGAMSNNADLAAQLNSKLRDALGVSVNAYYAAIGEAELAADIFRFHGAGIGMQVSALYAHPELKVKDSQGEERHIGLTQMEIARANLTVSFNGTDPYTMFELPYHSNHEAILGITGMILHTEKTELNSYAKDSLHISNIYGDYSQALGVTFGWNWRLGESGWVFGVNGALTWVINKSHLLSVDTDEKSAYTSGKLGFAPRILTAGFGYHF